MLTFKTAIGKTIVIIPFQKKSNIVIEAQDLQSLTDLPNDLGLIG